MKKLIISIVVLWTALFHVFSIYGQQETIIKRINCGGQQVTGEDGLLYDADSSSSGDFSFSVDSDALTHLNYVSPPLNEPYITSRLISRNVGTEFSYTFYNLSNSYQYRLIMHFAEPYHGVANSNWQTRVFDIDINNGEHLINDYNIMTAAALPSTNPLDGAKKVSKINRIVNITGNTLVIKFSNVSNDALVNAIEIYRIENLGDTQVPTAPALSSTGQGQTTVDLTWSGATDNVGVAGYKIFKDGVLETTLNNVSTYQATGLTAGIAYGFAVTALDAAGNESAASNTVTVTTDSGTGSGGGSSANGSIWSQSGSTASYTGAVAVGRSTVPNGYQLAVEGHVRAREIRVDQDTWPDYVFKEGYDLLSLKEIQQYIQERGHLPNIPSAKKVEADGVELGKMNRLLLEKIEEQMLYILQLEKRIKQLENQKQ